MINPNDKAFPMLTPTGYDQPGLTKLEFFAAAAMNGLLASGRVKVVSDHNVVYEEAVIHAKHLINQLNKESKNIYIKK